LSRKVETRKKNQKAPQTFGSNGVFYTFLHGEAGQIEIKIDFAQVLEPVNYYYADAIRIAIDEGLQMGILSFGRRDEATNKFADRIDVAMPMKALLGPFWISTRPIEEAVDKILDASGVSAKSRPIVPPEAQAQTLFANMIFLAAGDGESTFDFYHLSPREVHLAKTQKKDMHLIPIVRVIMSSVLTKEFFIRLRPYAEQAAKLQPVPEGSRRVAST
jgi:hypothetical protein